MRQALAIFANLYAVWVIGASGLAFVYPGLLDWFGGPWVTWSLALVMLGMGLTLHPSDFARVAKVPVPVAVGFLAQYTIMPTCAWLIARVLQLEPAFAVGLILVGCCPGGTASNLVAYLARANVPLSVVLTMVSTLLAPVMTPLLMEWLGGRYVPVNAWGIFLSTVQVVLVPVLLGVFINHRFHRVAARANVVGPPLAVVAITLIAGSIVARNVEAIQANAGVLALAGLLLHTFGFVLGYWVIRLLRFPQWTARTISIEVGMQNSGLAMVLANQHFSPLTASPAVFSSVFHTVCGSLCAAYWRLRKPSDGSQPCLAEVPDKGEPEATSGRASSAGLPGASAAQPPEPVIPRS